MSDANQSWIDATWVMRQHTKPVATVLTWRLISLEILDTCDKENALALLRTQSLLMFG
jgi:hypothetical protein